MKIAFVAQPFDKVRPPVQNSLGIWTYEVARRLAGAHEVFVYLRGGRFRFKALDEEDIHYRLVPTDMDRRMLTWLNRLPAGRDPSRPLFASKWCHYAYARSVARDLRRQQCDVVHVLNYSQFVPIIRRHNPGIRIVLHMQCEWLTQLHPRLIGPRLEQADLVIGCSKFIAEKAGAAFPEFPDRFQAVYNGVDATQFAPATDPPPRRPADPERLLFVGRVSPEKGIHVLLDAFRQVVARRPNVRLDIVGADGAVPREFVVALSDDPQVTDLARFYDRDYRAYLNEQVSGDLADRVSFLGNLPYAEVVDRYRRADVFVFPSVWDEPFGMPNIEAMACGTPVVATKSGGIPELIEHGRTGFLVERGDADGLAASMLAMLEDAPLRESMGVEGRRRVTELFTWDRIVDDLLGQYRTICDCDRALAAVL